MKNNHSSFSSVLNAIKLMQHYQVEFNTLTVVNNINVKYPLRIYKFLKSLNIHFMQFIPVVEMDKNTNINYMPSWMEHNNVNLAEFSVNPLEYGNFINTIFDEWIRHDIAIYPFVYSIHFYSILLDSLHLYVYSCHNAVVKIWY